jgi:hypothetical protein
MPAGKGEGFMARNFRVSVRRENAILHLKLAGDFDGGSAFELLKILEKNCRSMENVIIHTNGLKDINPYGRDLFNKNLRGLIDKHLHLVFIGAHEREMMAKGGKVL